MVGWSLLPFGAKKNTHTAHSILIAVPAVPNIRELIGLIEFILSTKSV